VGALAGKVAIVTGASSGLGVDCAVALAEAGADVAIDLASYISGAVLPVDGGLLTN
jgi:NAD(P)-dependent dehydrogenase (short-subunit alcohol dehydrogenase family)